MTVRYIHLRERDIFGCLRPTGGVTVAYDVADNGTVTYTHSECSWKDHYCKRIGRSVSQGRLEKGHNVRSFTKVDGVNVVKQILNYQTQLEKKAA